MDIPRGKPRADNGEEFAGKKSAARAFILLKIRAVAIVKPEKPPPVVVLATPPFWFTSERTFIFSPRRTRNTVLCPFPATFYRTIRRK